MSLQAQSVELFRAGILVALATPPASQHLWLLYDPVLNASLPSEHLSDYRILPLRLPQGIQLAPQRRPGFIHLPGGLDDRLFESSITAAHAECATDPLALDGGRSMAAWVWVDDEAAIRRLCGWASQVQPGHGMRWARWHDPRVFSLLWPSLSPEQQARFMHGVHRWVSIDLQGRSASISMRPGAAADATQGTSTWGLQAPQWQCLENTADVLRLLALHPGSGPATASGALREAQAAALATPADRLAYASFLLAGGDAQAQATHSALQGARQSPDSLEFLLPPVRQASAGLPAT